MRVWTGEVKVLLSSLMCYNGFFFLWIFVLASICCSAMHTMCPFRHSNSSQFIDHLLNSIVTNQQKKGAYETKLTWLQHKITIIQFSMRIDSIDLSKQINHNRKEGANKHSSAPTPGVWIYARAHTHMHEKEQIETQKRKNKCKQHLSHVWIINWITNKLHCIFTLSSHLVRAHDFMVTY